MQRPEKHGFTLVARAAVVLVFFLSNAGTHASAAASSSPANEWTMFRGDPALTGVSQSTVPDQPSLLWTFKTGAAVKSSAVIGSGTVFIGSTSRQENSASLGVTPGEKLFLKRLIPRRDRSPGK